MAEIIEQAQIISPDSHLQMKDPTMRQTFICPGRHFLFDGQNSQKNLAISSKIYAYYVDDDKGDRGRKEMRPLLLFQGCVHQHRNGQQGLEVHLIFKRNRCNPHFCNGSEVI